MPSWLLMHAAHLRPAVEALEPVLAPVPVPVPVLDPVPVPVPAAVPAPVPVRAGVPVPAAVPVRAAVPVVPPVAAVAFAPAVAAPVPAADSALDGSRTCLKVAGGGKTSGHQSVASCKSRPALSVCHCACTWFALCTAAACSLKRIAPLHPLCACTSLPESRPPGR